MCWITLTPSKPKKNNHHSDHGSSVEELVRVHRAHDGSNSRYSKVRIVLPDSLVHEEEDHDHYHHHHHHHPHLPHLHHGHHHHHHMHPLHLHPPFHHDHLHFHTPKLHGSGKKRCPAPPPPPPSPAPSSRPRSPSREPIYKTQLVEPADIQETTRIALRQVRPGKHKSRLRRVAGYEVLGREVPWNWDCISSAAGGSKAGGSSRSRGRSRSAHRFPPFGGPGSWM